jgi:hypothetical protein
MSAEGGETVSVSMSMSDFEGPTKTLGKGASGTVVRMTYKPPDGTPPRPCAVKIISNLNEQEKANLITELNTLLSCESPYIVKCYGAFYNSVSISDSAKRIRRHGVHGLGHS